MSYYLEQIRKGSFQLAESIDYNSNTFYKLFQERFDYKSHLNALFFGCVQSGKTAQILGVISRLSDEDLPIFLYLTTDNILLYRQTYDRIKESFDSFTICGEHEETSFQKWDLSQPLIIVLKKNAIVLKKWKNYLGSKTELIGRPLVFIDDEADASSINTKVNKSIQSTINLQLSEIKNRFTSSLYIQLTATPQALILQNNISGWSPDISYFFKPGESYVGGNYMYSRPKSYAIIETPEFEFEDIKDSLDEIPFGLRESLVYYLVVCAYFQTLRKETCNFLIHPSVRMADHNAFANQICQALNDFIYICNEEPNNKHFSNELKKAWSNLQRTKPDIANLEELKPIIFTILRDMSIRILVYNSNTIVNEDYKQGFNVIIGGNSLGRGVTIPNLQVVYYCRKAKKYQADTYWQHSRIFGYDRVPSLIRLFLPRSLYNVFVQINESNNFLIEQLSNNRLEGVQILLSGNIVPTRKNVLNNKYLITTVGGINYFPLSPIENNADVMDTIMDLYKDGLHQVDTDMLITILSNLGYYDNDEWDCRKYLKIIQSLSLKKIQIKCLINVKRDRDISKGTGTLLSPDDRAIGKKHSDSALLTLYRLNGKIVNGWSDTPFWVPNILLPVDWVFYDAIDEL